MTPERSDNATLGRCCCVVLISDVRTECHRPQEPDSPFCEFCASRHPALDSSPTFVVTVSRHSGVRSTGHRNPT